MHCQIMHCRELIRTLYVAVTAICVTGGVWSFARPTQHDASTTGDAAVSATAIAALPVASHSVAKADTTAPEYRSEPLRAGIEVEMLTLDEWNANTIELCQYATACEPCRNCPITGVDCLDQQCGRELTWGDRRPLPWQVFAHGDYVGPARTSHVPKYRLRVNDQVSFVFRLTREQSAQPYKLNVGDTIKIELANDKDVARELIIQPDGTISLPYAGQVHAAGQTVAELKAILEEAFKPLYPEPDLTVTPLLVDTILQDIRNTVDNRSGLGGQSFPTTVSPDGSIQLPAIGTVFTQGLTLEELQYEIEERYRAITPGLEVTPVLRQRAPRFVFVMGEVGIPGRYELTGPTSAMQAIALAQGWKQGGNLRQIVVFRRTDDWRLIATRLDLRGALYGKRPVPSDEVWLRDADIVLVPKTPLQRTDELVNMVFTQGVNPMLSLATGLSLLEPSFF
ncbi:MAG: polysaccharide biosynthesis/export family protein [Planctomycetales bacterium]|nr:polysaccharide biosynthesis/export family protein [Planctomycetales bacterium]